MLRSAIHRPSQPASTLPGSLCDFCTATSLRHRVSFCFTYLTNHSTLCQAQYSTRDQEPPSGVCYWRCATIKCWVSSPQMTTRSNAPASLKRWDKSGYVTVLTISKLKWGKTIPHLSQELVYGLIDIFFPGRLTDTLDFQGALVEQGGHRSYRP